jgi:hypothetical protein
MIASLKNKLFSSNDTDPNVLGGSDAVFQAILEHTDEEHRYTIELGEPELVDRGRAYKTEYMVKIPAESDPGAPDVADLEYPIPMNGEGFADTEFAELLEFFCIEEIAGLDEIEGAIVFGEIENGTLFPVLN